jgi:hypothetical protein
MKFYKIENNKLITGSGKTLLPDFTEFTTTQDEEGNEVFPVEMQPYLDAEAKVQAYSDWKAERQTKVDNIEVEYLGVIYQGDEISQTRLARAITSLPNDTQTVFWVAKDNSVNGLVRSQLQDILLLAGAKQAEAWNDGRPTTQA